MKKIALLLFLGLLAGTLLLAGCGGPPKVTEGPVDTVTEEPADTVVEEPTPPPPPADLKESQFMTVFFDFDKYSLRADAKTALEHNADLFKEFPDVIVRIEGHCDERGTVEYNLSLGEKRARATMDYMVGLGVNASRLSIVSYGKERPVDEGHTEDAWVKNRRSEFKIISQ